MVLITSKLALSRSIDCTTLTEEALRAKQRLVKFDSFFKELVPMKSYVYNSLVYNFVNRNLHCTDVENHYRIRFNWTSRVGIYQLYSNLAEMCSIVTVFKDGNGNMQVRAGVEGRYSTNQYRVGFTVDRKSFQRLYFLAQDDARLVVEFWLTEVPSGSAIRSGTGQNCNVSLLDLSLYQDLNESDFSANQKKITVILCCFILILSVVVIWLMIRCFQRYPAKNQTCISIMYRNSD